VRATSQVFDDSSLRSWTTYTLCHDSDPVVGGLSTSPDTAFALARIGRERELARAASCVTGYEDPGRR